MRRLDERVRRLLSSPSLRHRRAELPERDVTHARASFRTCVLEVTDEETDRDRTPALRVPGPALGADRAPAACHHHQHEDSGLLPILNPPFEKLTGITVDVIAVGTGKAIKLGENGDVDVVLVHDREAEDKFIAQGFGVNRRDVMHNDFVIVGPREDPAKIAGAEDSPLRLSRGLPRRAPPSSPAAMQSGTNAKEMDLWAAASVKPKGAWYKEAGQGMGKCSPCPTT